MVKTIKDIFLEASSLNDYLSSRGINPKFVSRDTKISHAKSALFQKWKSDRKMSEETITEASESELLAKYLNSRGINAKYATRDMKIAHSKSGEFLKWKRDHQHLELGEEVLDEAKMPRTTALDRWRKAATEREIKHNNIEKARQEKLHQDPSKVTIPVANTQKDDLTLAIDRLEKHLNKEEVQLNEVSKSEVEHHFDNWTNSEHAPYNSDAGDDNKVHQSALRYLRSTNVPKENHEKLAMHIAHKFHGSGIDEATGISKEKETKFHKNLDTLVHKTFGKRKDELKMKEEVEQIDEISKDTLKSYADKALRIGNIDNKKGENRVNQRHKGMQRAMNRLYPKPTSENTLDSLAATEAPSDCSDNTNSTPTTGKSYAARMVKSLKKTVKEETYDWEKDDKSSQEKPYGKAPKINVTDKTGTLGDTKPEARVVMKGGKTLTGQPRDMVEIDPSMKQRPGQQDKGQSTFTSPIAKKSP
jgi:hypothetical protein